MKVRGAAEGEKLPRQTELRSAAIGRARLDQEDAHGDDSQHQNDGGHNDADLNEHRHGPALPTKCRAAEATGVARATRQLVL